MKKLSFKGINRKYEVSDPPTFRELTSCMDDLNRTYRLRMIEACADLEDAVDALQFAADMAPDDAKEVLARTIEAVNGVKGKLLTGK